jgi:hypothetical protein
MTCSTSIVDILKFDHVNNIEHDKRIKLSSVIWVTQNANKYHV